MNSFKVLCLYMTWRWFYSNETVKCSWSDSQSSFGDVVYVLFVWLNQKYVITLKSNHDMDQNLFILSRKSISWHRTWTLCPHLDSRRWNHCERHTRFSVYNVNKTTSLLFIHSHRDSQNIQTSNLNRLLQLNIYRYWSILRFDLHLHLRI